MQQILNKRPLKFFIARGKKKSKYSLPNYCLVGALLPVEQPLVSKLVTLFVSKFESAKLFIGKLEMAELLVGKRRIAVIC